MTNYSISDIEGIGPKLCVKLEKAGISLLSELFDACSTKKGRKLLSDKTGISEEKLLKWVNIADLYRVQGVGAEYTELLEASGVEAINELQEINPERLYEKMVKVNSAKKFVLQVPSMQEITSIIQNAKSVKSLIMN